MAKKQSTPTTDCTRCGYPLTRYGSTVFCSRCRDESSTRALKVEQGKISLGAAKRLAAESRVDEAIGVLRELIAYYEGFKQPDAVGCDGAKEMLRSLIEQRSARKDDS